jgi:uncharacterized protein YbjT (DUF2867 family)
MNFAITGITGRVGGGVGRALVAAGESVRAVVRDAAKASPWADLGCSVAVAELNDAAALATAFAGSDAVFVLLPADFDPSPGFPERGAIVEALRAALITARPSRVVCLSTVGAQAKTENLLTTLSMMERAFGELPMPIAFLRPAWFLENSSWDVPDAKRLGVISSFLQPLDRPLPMVATADVSRVAVRMLCELWSGRRVVELEGPARISPNDIAAAFSRHLGKPVRARAVPRDTWPALFAAQGMKNPTPRMRMLDGFNQGWIDFEAGEAGTVKGATTLDSVVAALIAEP